MEELLLSVLSGDRQALLKWVGLLAKAEPLLEQMRAVIERGPGT